MPKDQPVNTFYIPNMDQTVGATSYTYGWIIENLGAKDEEFDSRIQGQRGFGGKPPSLAFPHTDPFSA